MTVNFRIDEASNHIIVDVFVNEEGPFKFVLDTGAKATSISKKLAEKIGIETLDLEVEDVSVITKEGYIEVIKKAGFENIKIEVDDKSSFKWEGKDIILLNGIIRASKK